MFAYQLGKTSNILLQIVIFSLCGFSQEIVFHRVLVFSNILSTLILKNVFAIIEGFGALKEEQDCGVMFTYNTLTWFNDNEVTWQWTLNLYVSLSSQFSWHIRLILNLFSHMTVPQSSSRLGTRLFELVFCCHQFWVVCLYLIGERFLVFIDELLQSLAFFSNDFYLLYTWK